MKALSLRQPWAELVRLGLKRIETRGWKAPDPPEFFALHASAKMTLPEKEFALELEKEGIIRFDTLPRGYVVGVCLLARIEEMTPEFCQRVLRENPAEYRFGHYHPGRWALHVRMRTSPERFAPIRAKGALGFWNFPDAMLPAHWDCSCPRDASGGRLFDAIGCWRHDRDRYVEEVTHVAPYAGPRKV